jgi:predicted RNA-binding Zn-ribbon protein involved in translation (DUF1610 family)
MPENLIRCAVCRQRVPEKLAQVTWAWIDAERLRTSVRQRLCTQCFAGRVLALDNPVEPDSELTCVSCGISVEDDLAVLYCTAYLPGVGPMRYQFPFCGEHILIAQQMCRENAQVLGERESMLGGQAPQRENPSLAAWRALGIEPNDAA